MVSKKVLGPALTGTGAVGASGALAWTLGLLDEEILDDVVVEGKKNETLDSAKQPKPPQENQNAQKEDKPAAKSPPSKGPQAPSTPLQGPSSGSNRGDKVIIATRAIAGQTATSAYFSSSDATDEDKEVIKQSLTWNVEWNGGLKSILVKAGESGNASLWECRLKHTSIKEVDANNNSELINQGKKLIEEINKNGTHKEKFVENCSRTRENKGGQIKTYGFIELEMEKSSDGKIRFRKSNGYFKKLWTEDFAGVYKLSQEDENLLDLSEGKWDIVEIKEEGENKKRKVKISLKEINKSWICHISGNYSGNNLGGKTFKKEELEKILKRSKSYGYENEVEWKRYLFRNCRKNGMNIEGLKIKVTGSNWDFEEASLKKITEEMYTNPTTLS